MKYRSILVVIVLWCTIFSPVPIQGAEKKQIPTTYQVQVTFNPQETRLKGEVTIPWQNHSGMDLNRIPLFLKNDDKEKDLIQSCLVNDRSAKIEYKFNTEENSFTGFEAVLSKPVAPNEKCTIRIQFKSFKGELSYGYYHFCHNWRGFEDWLPTLLVMEKGKIYTTRQSLSNYDVTLTYPKTFLCASTGKVVSESIKGESKILHLSAKEVPDFGILLSKAFIIEEAEASGVLIRSFYFEKEKKWGKALLKMAQDIVPFYVDTIGFYPQPIITILPGHTEPWGGYPICANCVVIHGGLDKKGETAEEFARWILAHEIGHEYFGFGHILEDKAYPAWFGLSMGIYTDRLYNTSRGIHRSDYHTRWNYYMAGILAGLNTTILQKLTDLKHAGFDWNNVIAHSKSSTVLSMLEHLVGEKTFRTIFQTYLKEHKGETVTLESFKETCEAISGKDLDWFFHQWYETPAYLDFRVKKMRTWKADKTFITECTIIRKGDAVMPLTVMLKTSSGESITQQTDGWFKERTLTFRSDSGPVKIVIDPEMRLPLLAHAEKSGIYGMARSMLVQMEKYDKALHIYRKAYEIGKDFPNYWYYLATLYMNVGDLEAAMESLDRVETLKTHEDYEPFLALGTLEKGKIYDLMGKRADALKQYRLALKNERTQKEAEQYLKTPFSQR